MGNAINKQFQLRRNGGEASRASETSATAYSVNQERTMANMGMVDSGMNMGHPMNYGTPMLKKIDEFGNEVPEGFKSSTGKDYEITASEGTLKGRQTSQGPKGRDGSPTVTEGSGKRPLQTKKGETTTRQDGNTTTRTTYGKTKKSPTPGKMYGDFKKNKEYDTTTKYKKEQLKIKDYKA